MLRSKVSVPKSNYEKQRRLFGGGRFKEVTKLLCIQGLGTKLFKLSNNQRLSSPHTTFIEELDQLKIRGVKH